jgi:hypothetical protein
VIFDESGAWAYLAVSVSEIQCLCTHSYSCEAYREFQARKAILETTDGAEP